MNRNDYDNIAKCIRRRGTKGQKQALKKLMGTVGWDRTHGNKLQIQQLRTQIAELETENHLLRLKIHRKKKAG